MLRKWILATGLVLAIPAVSIAQGQQVMKKGVVSNGISNTFVDCTVVAGNLVANCGFETGDFTGWINGGDPTFTSVSNCGHSGTFCAFMGQVNYNGTLTQSLATSGTCSLSFWVASNGQPSRFSVEWRAKTVFIFDVVPTMPYQQFSVSDLPGGGGAFLTFTFYNPPSFTSLDDIVVLCS